MFVNRMAGLALCLMVGSGAASAATSFTLYGTGFSSTGTLLSAGSQDGNWSLVSGPEVIPTGGPFVTDTGQFPFPNWLADTSSSQWISPKANESSSSDGNSSTVPYVYEETFDLTGLDTSTIDITGKWSADNYGEILLNGTVINSGSIPDDPGEFGSFTSFTIDAATLNGATVNQGSNTLEFEVFNNANGSPDVTGLNVDIITAQANSSAPEPGTCALMGLGLTGLGLLRRRRA